MNWFSGSKKRAKLKKLSVTPRETPSLFGKYLTPILIGKNTGKLSFTKSLLYPQR